MTKKKRFCKIVDAHEIASNKFVLECNLKKASHMYIKFHQNLKILFVASQATHAKKGWLGR